MARRNVRAATAAAAQRLLQDKVDLVVALAESGATLDELEEAEKNIAAQIAAARAEYTKRYRAATEGGWTDEQLTEAECPASRGDGSLTRRRRRRASSRREQDQPGQPAATGEPIDPGSTHVVEPIMVS